MVAAVGPVAKGFWWAGIAVFVLVVVPAVIVLANRLVAAVRRTRDATADVAEHVGGVRENVEVVATLEETARLLEQAEPLLARRS